MNKFSFFSFVNIYPHLVILANCKCLFSTFLKYLTSSTSGNNNIVAWALDGN